MRIYMYAFLQKLEMLRLHLRDKYSQHQQEQLRQEELGYRLIKIVFRLPDASKLEHSFNPTDATKVKKKNNNACMYIYAFHCHAVVLLHLYARYIGTV